MAEEFLRSMRGSGASPVGVMTPFLMDTLQDILVFLKVADSVASVGDLWHSLSALNLTIYVPSGPEDAESHRNLRRHGAGIPGSLTLHLFSIRLVRFVLILLLMVLFVNGLTPTQFDFSLVHFCLGGPLLAVTRSEWLRIVCCFCNGVVKVCLSCLSGHPTFRGHNSVVQRHSQEQRTWKVVVATRSRQKQNHNRVLVGTTATMPMHERRWIDIEPSEQNLPRTICRRKWSIFFDTIKRYRGKKMEQLNSTKSILSSKSSFTNASWV